MSLEINLAEIGKRIEGLRGDLSQIEFAARLGVDRKTVGTWERGERLPDTKALLGLLAHFNADPAWVLTGKDAAGAIPPLAPDEAALLDNYRHSPKDQRDLLKATSAAFAQPKLKKKAG